MSKPLTGTELFTVHVLLDTEFLTKNADDPMVMRDLILHAMRRIEKVPGVQSVSIHPMLGNNMKVTDVSYEIGNDGHRIYRQEPDDESRG